MLNTALTNAGEVAPTFIRDVAGLSGVALIAYGAWLCFPPAGFIAAGVMLIAGAVLSSKRHA